MIEVVQGQEKDSVIWLFQVCRAVVSLNCVTNVVPVYGWDDTMLGREAACGEEELMR